MKRTLSNKMDAREIDTVLFALNHELANVEYRLESTSPKGENDINYNDAVAYKEDLIELISSLLYQLSSIKFEGFGNPDENYRFLKFEHFKPKNSKKINYKQKIIRSYSKLNNRFEDLDFDSILEPFDDQDAEIINSIGRGRLIELITLNHLGFLPDIAKEMIEHYTTA